MRSILFGFFLLVSGAALADSSTTELSDANKALASKAYPQALQLYGKLATAGNHEAQLRLGEMYWYGEGVTLDRDKGDALFALAASGGNAEAVTARTLSTRRAQNAAGITYWTTTYDGADLTAGKFNCVAPTIPAASKTNAEIAATNKAVAGWRECYDAFGANLNAGLPAGKRIPADIAVVMSEPETEMARAHVDKVYGAVINKAQANAQAFMARQAAWETATVAAVAEENVQIAVRTKRFEADRDAEARLRENTRFGDMTRPGAPAAPIKK
jgi:TPR repeat protein